MCNILSIKHGRFNFGITSWRLNNLQFIANTFIIQNVTVPTAKGITICKWLMFMWDGKFPTSCMNMNHDLNVINILAARTVRLNNFDYIRGRDNF